MLQMMMIGKVFCSGVPVNTKRYARPMTMPGMVFVTRAMLSSTFFNFPLTVLLAVTSAPPYAISVPASAVMSATTTELTYTP